MSDHFFIRYNGRFQRVRLEEILYVEASRNYCRLVTVNETYILLTSLTKIRAALPAGDFCQVHRAYIVALSRIDSFTLNELKLAGKKLPLGERFRPDLMSHLTLLGQDSPASANPASPAVPRPSAGQALSAVQAWSADQPLSAGQALSSARALSAVQTWSADQPLSAGQALSSARALSAVPALPEIAPLPAVPAIPTSSVICVAAMPETVLVRGKALG